MLGEEKIASSHSLGCGREMEKNKGKGMDRNDVRDGGEMQRMKKRAGCCCLTSTGKNTIPSARQLD